MTIRMNVSATKRLNVCVMGISFHIAEDVRCGAGTTQQDRPTKISKIGIGDD